MMRLYIVVMVTLFKKNLIDTETMLKNFPIVTVTIFKDYLKVTVRLSQEPNQTFFLFLYFDLRQCLLYAKLILKAEKTPKNQSAFVKKVFKLKKNDLFIYIFRLVMSKYEGP